jgi:hypothetical protein
MYQDKCNSNSWSCWLAPSDDNQINRNMWRKIKMCTSLFSHLMVYTIEWLLVWRTTVIKVKIKYNPFTNSHTLQFTRAYTEVFTVLTSCCLVAASSGRCSPSSGFPNCPLPQLPASNSSSSQQLNCSSPLTLHWLTDWPTEWPADCPAYLSMDCTKNTIHLLLWKHACLLSCSLLMAVVYLLISWSLPSNLYTCQNMKYSL